MLGTCAVWPGHNNESTGPFLSDAWLRESSHCCQARQQRLPLLPNLCAFDFCSWLALTDPRDVARIESKTVIVTQEQRDAVPIPKSGLSQLGCWMSEDDFEKAFSARFPGCMKGKQNVYLIGQNVSKPFLMSSLAEW